MLIIDDHSRMSGYISCRIKAIVEKQSGQCVKALRSDHGGEFTLQAFNSFCEEHDKHGKLTAPHTPEQKGVAARKNRTVVDMARSMFLRKNLPNQFRVKL